MIFLHACIVSVLCFVFSLTLSLISNVYFGLSLNEGGNICAHFSVAWKFAHGQWLVCGWRNAFECDFCVFTHTCSVLVSICRHSAHIAIKYAYVYIAQNFMCAVFIRVPSDLTEATRVSIQTQHCCCCCCRRCCYCCCFWCCYTAAVAVE